MDKIMDIMYHFIPTTWKNEMIEQGFNYMDSAVKKIFETTIEYLKPKEEKNKCTVSCKKK